MGVHAQQVTKLADGNNNARGGDKTGDHRMGQKVGEKAHSQNAHQQQERPGEQCQQHGGIEVAHAADLGNAADGAGRHQRNHGHRAHRQAAAAAQQAVGDEWQHTGVETNFGRQAGKQGVGQRLRDKHDRHNDGRQQVGGELAAVVLLSPFQDG